MAFKNPHMNGAPETASLKGTLRYFLGRIKRCAREDPAAFWHAGLFWLFWVSIAFFPIGYGFREGMPLACLVCLGLFYKYGWRQSVLRRLKPAWLFLCPLLMTLIGIAFSINPWNSLLHAGTGVNKAFILPFIAMECVRSPGDLRRLVWAFVFACFWQGIDGIWQAITGHDFIMGYQPNSGRLTGSLGDYTVGNYIALALIPAFGVWFILREKFDMKSALFLAGILFMPAFFLLAGASSRSGALAIAGAVFLWFALKSQKINWRMIVWPCAIIGAFMLCQPARITTEAVLKDNRWDLWKLGWKIFEAHPWLGAGAGQYNAAFRELGLAPKHEAITISHPHNLYLDILYAHGIVGFALGIIFLAGFFFWCFKKIAPRLRNPGGEEAALYWQLTAWMFLGYAGWLVNGIFGHDFYRIWWLAMAMSSLGITLGAIVNAPES